MLVDFLHVRGSDMRLFSMVIAVLTTSALAACGGGGGGGMDPIVPITPPPSNSSITNLTVSQTFNAVGNNQQAVFDLRNGTVVSASGSSANLQVAYDAALKSYTVFVNGESATFRPSDQKSNI